MGISLGLCCCQSPTDDSQLWVDKALPLKMNACGLKRVIVVAGPPAAGKGTQCDLITERYGLVHISVGQLLRDHIHRGTGLGNDVKDFVDSGALVPSDMVVKLLDERLSQPDVLDRGCLLDNFPFTAEQAEAMRGRIAVDQFILLDVPDEAVMERALGRRVDPLVGTIYHVDFEPPPSAVLRRVVSRTDDVESAIKSRLQNFRSSVDSVVPAFEGKTLQIDGMKSVDEMFAIITTSLDKLEWSSPDFPYFGNKAFNGPFTAADSRKAGFFSPDEPPYVGDHVVCFRRGEDWHRRGRVSEVEDETSDGCGGLRQGHEGVKVTVEQEDGATFKSWSAFLAPVNDKEYSSICSTSDFRSSNFGQFFVARGGIGDADAIPKSEARESLVEWLQNLEDADGEPFEINDARHADLLAAFDEHEAGSLYLYSTHQTLGTRTSLITGQDYSLYYRAINNTLNSDEENNLRNAMKLIHRMIYLLLYHDDGQKRKHAGGRVWKGDTTRPVPLNLHRLKEAQRHSRPIRFRQFQSTTSDEAIARKYLRREDSRGFLWTIDIPEGFWGARDIQDLAAIKKESETLFPPYSAFLVTKIDEDECHLQAVARDVEVKSKAERQGLELRTKVLRKFRCLHALAAGHFRKSVTTEE